MVENGRIKHTVVTEPGSGYSAPPQATLPGMEAIKLKATLRFGKDLKKNGSIESVEVISPKRSGTKP